MIRYRYNHFATKAEAVAFAEAIDPECFVNSIRHEPRSEPAWIVEWTENA